jgi:NAD(P)H-dependent flavin oxidoreductase YrpB (nitropropane dioxygenase family)
MKTSVNELLDIEFPIFAFSHCRDVVAAVTNAGGLGVLGAVAHTPEDLEIDLVWIDEHVDGRPYGVDLLMPSKFEGVKEGGIERTQLRSKIPEGHVAFLDHLLEEHKVPALPPRDPNAPKKAGLQVDPKSMAPLIDIAFNHDIKLIASALGSPPRWLVDKARERGIVVAALAGTVEHARRHVEAGVDIVIAQGTEAGGHTGDISTLVLVPQIVDAVSPMPVLAAGGIANGRQMAASIALGAAGVWTGSIWLSTEESESTPAERAKFLVATSGDTVRSRSMTGKPCRMLRSDWTEAWEAEEAPKPLPMPLQSMLVHRYRERIDRVAGNPETDAAELLSPFVGQVVGMMHSVKPARRVVYEMIEEFIEATERLSNATLDDA